MSKKESTFLSMVVSLLLITLISGFALGFVNDLTIEPKAKAKLEKKVNAIKLVLPEFDNNPVEDVKKIKTAVSKDSVEVYPAFKNNQFVGAAVISYSEKGFSGLVKIMVGFKADGAIKNIAVLEQKETPGLGTKMKDESFLRQFRDKNPDTFNLKVKKDGGDIDALTGATISSRAFSESAKMAYDIFVKNLDVINQTKH
ncbi:RnfABCDGE type electron transport complex subunit G [Thalassobellus citreus]|uniref:RnfABCDGE type electron transport complex subunit G n=1 Tax=Thalassobellus citreus TaxID=3367752 RepID=UPI003787BFAC